MPDSSYPRSSRTPRGEARRAQLLELVTQDLLDNGLAGFSMRRAARAAGTTHKVLLYHFEDADDLLAQAVQGLRRRRAARALEGPSADLGLADWVEAAWEALDGEEAVVLDRVLGLVMSDPQRYQRLARGLHEAYLPLVLARCPEAWSPRRKQEMASMIVAAVRGFMIERTTTGDEVDVSAGLAALRRAIEREVARDEEPLDEQ